MHWKKIGAICGLALLGAAVPAPARADPPPGAECRPSGLAVPGGVGATLVATDPTGRHQVGSTHGPDPRLVLWAAGGPTDLGPENGFIPGGSSWAADVNAGGTVVGGSRLVGGLRMAWRRTPDGAVRLLPVPGGAAGAGASAVNRDGAVVGTSQDGTGWDEHAVVWSADGAATVLPRPQPWNQAFGIDVDDAGNVVGVMANWNLEGAALVAQRAFVWHPDGSWRYLTGADPDSNTSVVAAAGGRAVGWDAGTQRAVAWDLATGLRTDLGTGLRPSATNARGDVLLGSYRPDAALLSGGVLHRLPAPPAEDPLMTSTAHVGVSDQGVVYGNQLPAGGTPRPYRWAC